MIYNNKINNFVGKYFFFSSDINKAKDLLFKLPEEKSNLIIKKIPSILDQISFSDQKIKTLEIFVDSSVDKIHALSSCSEIFEEFFSNSDKFSIIQKLDKISPLKTYAVSLSKDYIHDMSFSSDKMKFINKIINEKDIGKAFSYVGYDEKNLKLLFNDLDYYNQKNNSIIDKDLLEINYYFKIKNDDYKNNFYNDNNKIYNNNYNTFSNKQSIPEKIFIIEENHYNDNSSNFMGYLFNSLKEITGEIFSLFSSSPKKTPEEIVVNTTIKPSNLFKEEIIKPNISFQDNMSRPVIEPSAPFEDNVGSYQNIYPNLNNFDNPPPYSLNDPYPLSHNLDSYYENYHRNGIQQNNDYNDLPPSYQSLYPNL